MFAFAEKFFLRMGLLPRVFNTVLDNSPVGVPVSISVVGRRNTTIVVSN